MSASLLSSPEPGSLGELAQTGGGRLFYPPMLREHKPFASIKQRCAERSEAAGQERKAGSRIYHPSIGVIVSVLISFR